MYKSYKIASMKYDTMLHRHIISLACNLLQALNCTDTITLSLNAKTMLSTFHDARKTLLVIIFLTNK